MVKALSTTQHSTNGHAPLLPALLQGSIRVGGDAFVVDLLPVVSEQSGNTRWEGEQHFEVDNAKEGNTVLRDFRSKYNGVLLEAGKVETTEVKTKQRKDNSGTYTVGGYPTTKHVLADPIEIAGRKYKVTATARMKQRSRNKVAYLCVDVYFSVVLIGGGIGAGVKAKGAMTPVADDDWS